MLHAGRKRHGGQIHVAKTGRRRRRHGRHATVSFASRVGALSRRGRPSAARTPTCATVQSLGFMNQTLRVNNMNFTGSL